MSEHQSSRIGIDVGGTFTDAVIVAADGGVEIAKVPSTPERIERGFMDALAELLERSGSQAGDVGYLAHGSTVATNAIVQRRLARTALITNRGFRDVLAIGTQMRARGVRPVVAGAGADRAARAVPRGGRPAGRAGRRGRAARRAVGARRGGAPSATRTWRRSR